MKRIFPLPIHNSEPGGPPILYRRNFLYEMEYDTSHTKAPPVKVVMTNDLEGIS